MTQAKVKQAELFCRDAMGIYIPQHFAESAYRDKFTGIDAEQWAILEAGPDHGLYRDVWQEVLECAETLDGGTLWQDGDLWIVWPQLAIDVVDAECEAMEEYETSHYDAGDNYGFMAPEGWCEERTNSLIEQLSETVIRGGLDNIDDQSYWDEIPKYEGVNPDWRKVDEDTLADIALDCFTMEAGSIYGPYDGGIVLDSFAIGEIEVELSCLGIDNITMDLVRESCNAYIDGTDYAYIATDAVWYAVLDIEAFNQAIVDRINEEKG